MSYLTISSLIITLVVLALACSIQSLGAVMISQENGMEILANFTNSSANQSDSNATINETADNQTQASGAITNDKSGLWDWGKIPMGYVLDNNGTLNRVVDEEWKPSI
ncbi:MAG: hypothetical protein A4E49_02888 [Methanosaeta sp. PtaU1.Bin112]|nr:MAG: hypothetical protein A4E49_02888 [Methanosaeta sp. PtaU1.Bin112]